MSIWMLKQDVYKRQDVWVRDGEIMAVGVDAGGSAITAVDASGCVVTPGFVDIHRHCDAAPLRDADFGRVELAQGITCALAGNCGLAPVLSLIHI